jgi:hypothetical protein
MSDSCGSVRGRGVELTVTGEWRAEVVDVEMRREV